MKDWILVTSKYSVALPWKGNEGHESTSFIEEELNERKAGRL
jgi:hypothetical protein